MQNSQNTGHAAPGAGTFYEVTQFDVGRSFVTFLSRDWISPIGTIKAGDVGIRFTRCPTADILEAEDRQAFKDRIDAETRARLRG